MAKLFDRLLIHLKFRFELPMKVVLNRHFDTRQVEKGLSGEQAGLGLRSFDFTTSSSIASECPWSEALKCDTVRQGSVDTIYRRADGSCNNLKEPYYGRSTTPFQRLANPKYAAVNSNVLLSSSGVNQSNTVLDICFMQCRGQFKPQESLWWGNP